MKRTYYKTCENCGANLDPGEQCDCEKVETDRRRAIIWIPPEKDKRKRPLAPV